MSPLKVGVAQVDFTPEAGLPLLGNLRDDYASQGVHDPLMAKAIVIADASGSKAALMAMDICALTRDQVAMMRRAIAARCDIPAGHILISATHTHSGPSTCRIYTMPKSDDADIEAFLTTASEAAVMANADLADGDLQIGYAHEDRISFYRRIRCTDGQCRMNWETIGPDLDAGPYGEIDPQVAALAVQRADGLAAVMVNFGLHPAILDYENQLYSADYPGVLAQEMERSLGPGLVTAFFNGCCGNVNHIDHRASEVARRGHDMVHHVGGLLAESVTRPAGDATSAPGDGVRVSRRGVPLKRMPISRETYDWSLEAVKRLETDPPDGPEDGLPPEYAAPTWIEMYERQDEDDVAEVMAIRVGSLGVVGLPGEVFTEFGRRIKAESPAEHTMVIELANDAIGYLPTLEAFDQGGYEVTPGATLCERDAGERLTEAALEQLGALFNG
ncbi:MAG: neutral/alkaline non-lysosomal ceramidase N-terminal domain-containing protein [Candidatus Latescibacteria bacterium]|jgi:hypothetical protein|nr:neutral/alkaline non-lysosomal ceramidase N-terminal domain-containing protein [Candidatus Latescibacterota bacterium]